MKQSRIEATTTPKQLVNIPFSSVAITNMTWSPGIYAATFDPATVRNLMDSSKYSFDESRFARASSAVSGSDIIISLDDEELDMGRRHR